MGSLISFPVRKKQLSFANPNEYKPTGIHKEEHIGGPVRVQNEFEELTTGVFDAVLRRRIQTMEARAKFKELEFHDVVEQYPDWTHERFMDLKAQFQSFDINQDGLIDFPELCNVLDELGDHSNMDSRRKYFEELDEDGSGAVDFEEYLTVIDTVWKDNHELKNLNEFCQAGTETVVKIRQLSVVQQIDMGLF